jgi:hypothetical protein
MYFASVAVPIKRRNKHGRFWQFTSNDIEILITGMGYALETVRAERIFAFEAPLGWKGHIEKRHPGEAA